MRRPPPSHLYVTSENQTNKYLTTALHYAAQRGHVDASSGTGDEKNWDNAQSGKVFFPFSVAKMRFECCFLIGVLQNLGPYSERCSNLTKIFSTSSFSRLGALMRATFCILNWAHLDHLYLRLQVLNCWWSQRPRHWNEGSRKKLRTVGVSF